MSFSQFLRSRLSLSSVAGEPSVQETSTELYKHTPDELVRINDDLPISRLTDDILVEIFAQIGPSSYFYSEFVSHPVTWPLPHPRIDCIAFSHVCHRWREVALATPLLWTLPLFQWPNFAMKMIDRSGTAPLTLSWPYLHNKPPNTSSPYELGDRIRPLALAPSFYHACKHLDRVVELEIFESPALLNHVLVRLARPAPKLERLSIAVHLHAGSGPLRLTENNFSKLLPLSSLAALSLINCFLTPDVPLFARLTRLIIDADTNLASAIVAHREPISNVVACITQAPLLEYLTLRHVVDPTTLSAYSETPVHLDSLIRLEVDDDMRSVMALLSAVVIPTQSKLALFDRPIDGEETDQATAQHFLSVIAQHPSVKGRQYQDLVLKNEDNFHATLEAFRVGSVNHQEDAVDLEIHMEVESYGYASYLSLLTEQLDFGQLAYLEVELDTDTPYRRWYDTWPIHVPSAEECRTALLSMPKLIGLTLIRECAGIVFCRALDMVLSQPEETAQYVCPDLSTLVLISMTFVTRKTSIRSAILVESLTDVVETRSKCGHPLFSLNIKDSNVGTLDPDEITDWSRRFQPWVRYIDVDDPWTGALDLDSSYTGSFESVETDNTDSDTGAPHRSGSDSHSAGGDTDNDEDAWVTTSDDSGSNHEDRPDPDPLPFPGHFPEDEDDEAAWVTESEDGNA